VVCVVSLEDLRITPATVPHAQCREIRTEGMGGSAAADAMRRLDWIVVPASAAIVATVVIAVVIFVACVKSSQKSREAKILDEKPIHTLSMNGVGTMRAGGHGPAGPPLAGLAALGLGPPPPGAPPKDWDQLSAYSQRTDRSGLNRARMYHMERSGSINGGLMVPEDARSHLSAMSRRSGRSNASAWKKRNGSTVGLSRSIGDLTGKGYGLGLSRQGKLNQIQ